MGGIVSGPVDASTKAEIEEAIKTILATFTKEYIKAYAVNLVKKIKEDAQAEPEDWKLEEREPSKEDRKAGWVVKEGGVMKKAMNRRYMVIRHDYMIDYWASEDDFKAGKKPRGTISLCGYSVNPDANDTLINRLKKLAEKMGMNFDDLPKPKEYPKGTIEIHHGRRQTFYIGFDNDEDRKQWIEAFQNCCRFAYGLKNKDKVHKKAFHHAVRRTRWAVGSYGWWSYGGTEEQILSDLISDYLDWKILYKVYGKITGPWMIRNTIRNQLLKVLDKTVLAAVTPAWKAMSSAVEAARPKIEEKLKPGLEPIFKLQGELVDKMKSACMSVIDPILKEHVAPHLTKIVACIKSPMVEGFDVDYKLFDEQINKFEFKGGKEDAKKGFRDLDWFPWSWHMWQAFDKVDVMYEPLWALNTIFPDIYPWSLIWVARDTLRGKMDNAMYTFEKRLTEKLEAEASDPRGLIDSVKKGVMDDFKEDGKKATVIYYREIIKTIVMPPFQNKVFPAVESLLQPINDAIPEPMADIIDINGMFEDLLTGIIESSIDTVLGGSD